MPPDCISNMAAKYLGSQCGIEIDDAVSAISSFQPALDPRSDD